MDGYLEAIFRTLLSFVGILLYARLLGKQQMGQLTFYDYVTGITVGDIAANVALDPDHTLGISLWILTLFTALSYVTGVMTEKSRPLRKLIEGEPVILVHNGKILEHNMDKARYNMENLLMMLRQKDVFSLDDVEFAIAETDGDLSVQKKAAKRAVSPDDLGLQVPAEGLTSELIIDGEVIYANLKQNNLDESWLINQLKSLGYHDATQITYASVDINGHLYVDEVRDHLDPMVDISD